jgi:hypothetical protein
LAVVAAAAAAAAAVAAVATDAPVQGNFGATAAIAAGEREWVPDIAGQHGVGTLRVAGIAAQKLREAGAEAEEGVEEERRPVGRGGYSLAEGHIV